MSVPDINWGLTPDDESKDRPTTVVPRLIELRDKKRAFDFMNGTYGRNVIYREEQSLLEGSRGDFIPWNPQPLAGYVSCLASPPEEVFVERWDLDAGYFLPLFIEPPIVQRIVYPQSDFRSLFQVETLPYSELLDYL